MVAAHGCHHRAAAIARAHDGAAHRVPHIHEGERPRGVRPHAFDRRAFGPQRREIVTDTAPLLHGQRGLAQMGEDAGHVVRDRPHHEAVEEGDAAPGAGPGQYPSRGQKLEISQGFIEALGPDLRLVFGHGEGQGDALPAVLDGFVHNRAVRPFEPVFHVPDLLRDRCDARHGRNSYPHRRLMRS